MSVATNGQAGQPVVQWPEPPHLKLKQDQQALAVCEIELTDGKRQSGLLSYFTGRDDYLMFKPVSATARNEGIFKVDLSLIKQMRLTQPVQARPYDQDDAASAEQTQVYSVEFNDGEIQTGETSGHVNMPNGLFLYSQANDTPDALRRVFIPTSAVAYFQIGDPMGKLLVEENAVSEEDLQQAVAKQQEMRKQLLGDYLLNEAYITQDQLDQAMQLQQSRPSLRLGEALIEMGALTAAALDAALARQRSNRSRPLSQILIEMGVLDQGTLQKVHAKKTGLPFVSLTSFNIARKIKSRIPAEMAQQGGFIPLAMEEDALIVAFSSSPDTEILSKLASLAGVRVVPVMATAAEIRAKQELLYSGEDDEEDDTDDGAELLAQAEQLEVETINDPAVDKLFQKSQPIEMTEQAKPGELASDAVLLQVTQRLLSAGVTTGTLEIHIENEAGKRVTRIRYKKA